MKPHPKAEAVSEMIRTHINYPSRTIARFLVDKHPGLFKDSEEARREVRRQRGAAGKADRKDYPKYKSTWKEPGTPTDGCYPLPEPIADSRTEWKVRKFDFDKCFLFSDVHVPFHDRVALSVAIAFARRQEPDLILINGDAMDFYGASSFDKDPRRRFRLADEIEHGKSLLEHIRDVFPKAEIKYKEGNHEERLARSVWRDAPDLASVLSPDGVPCVDLPTLLDFAGFGIEHIGNKQPILLGDHLYVLHGHEFRAPMTNPVNPARGLYLRTKTNSICGDMHQTSQHTEAGLVRTISCWSIGCLCNLRPAYMPLNKWNHGFAMVESHKGDWSVVNHKIINGKVV
jgi:hypothetical protein